MTLKYLTFIFIFICNLSCAQTRDTISPNEPNSHFHNHDKKVKYRKFSVPYDSLAESINRAHLSFHYINTNILSRRFSGFSFEFSKYLFKNTFSVGLGVLTTQDQIPKDSFKYSTIEPRISFGQFNLIIQYIEPINKWLKFNFYVVSSYSIFTLTDNAFLIKKGNNEYAKTIAENKFITIEPGVGLSYRLFKMKLNQNVIWLNLRTHYRYSTKGEFEFGNIRQHNGFIYLAGLTYNYRLF